MTLAKIDIQQRYRRAVIGPFWLTISMGVMVLGMGLVYGTLLKQPLTDFLPFLAGGFMSWFFLSNTIIDGNLAFIQAEGLIKHGGLPLSIHVYRVVWRNLIILLHNAVVVILIYLWFGKLDAGHGLQALFGLLLTTLNLTWLLFLLGPLCARYRDLAPIVGSILQLMFFITPIAFHPNLISEIEWVYKYNPFYYLIEAIRAPLLGEGLALDVALVLLVSAVFGWVLAIASYSHTRSKIPFWV